MSRFVKQFPVSITTYKGFIFLTYLDSSVYKE